MTDAAHIDPLLCEAESLRERRPMASPLPRVMTVHDTIAALDQLERATEGCDGIITALRAYLALP
jgi:hypothetical protein